jgi:signal transduction histidine kinase
MLTGPVSLATLTPSGLSDIPPLSDVALWLAEQGGVGIAQWDRLGNLVALNSAFERMLARSTAGRAALPQVVSGLVQRTLMARKPVMRPITLELDGQTRHLWVRCVPVTDAQGEVVAIAGGFQDWTAELTRIEDVARDQARFKDFARASSDWFWEVDGLGRLTALSDRLTALLGVPASQFIGQPLTSLGRLEPNLSGDMPMTRNNPGHAPFRDQLLCLTTETGEPILFHLSGVPLFDSTGGFRGYRGAGMDVTRTYRMEQDARAVRRNLETALDELKETNVALDVASMRATSALAAKNQFLAAMSHELRTPLNAIIGFAETMELQMFGQLGEQYVGYARNIHSAGRHLLGLIEDILDVSVIESGDIHLSIEPIALGPLVEQARDFVSMRALGKGLDLSGAMLSEPVQVLADERRVLQILVNLFTNAVKFTPSGGKVSVSVVPNTLTGQVSVTVCDTGRGIAPEDHERVFEKFQQCVGDSYAGKPEGTGLGLHISRELARLMSGDLTVDSRLGAGARFTLTLPPG